MKRSNAFEAVLVILLIFMVSLIYFMVSTPNVVSSWEKQANGSVDYMFVGSNDTLYTFNGNDVSAFSKDGDLRWQMDVPGDWNILFNWETPSNGSMASSEFNSYPIVGESDGSLYLFEMYAINVSDVQIASSNITERNVGDVYYDRSETPYISKPAKIVKISPNGKIVWEYSFVTNLSPWNIEGLVKPADYDYEMDKPVAISVHGDRVYLFHDYTEDVLDTSGNLLFTINNVSAPATVDDQGHVYIVGAVKPTEEQFNQSILGNFSSDDGLSSWDSAMISEDQTFMLTSDIVEAYSPAGELLWSCNIGVNATLPYIDGKIWPYYNTLPLFSNNQLYVPVDDGIVQVGIDGKINWTTYVNGGEYTVFPLMPVDSLGNVYMANLGQSSSESNLTMISMDGHVSNNSWPFYKYDSLSNSYPGMVPVGGYNGVVYAYESLGSFIADTFETNFNQALSSHSFSADKIIAYDVAENKELWNFTVPSNDIHEGTLNESNKANAVGLDYNNYIDNYSLPLKPTTYSNVEVYPGENVTYLKYYYSIYEFPPVINQSRFIYASGIYALDNQGHLLWEIEPNGIVNTMVIGNTTIYYSMDNGSIGGSNINIAAGIATATLVYVFLRFFMLGTVTRARNRLDQNENRNRILSYIIDQPGVTAPDIAKDLGMNLGTIRYHLLILTLNHRIITHSDESKFHRYFKNSGSYTNDEKELLSLIRRKPLQRIVNALIEQKKLSGPDLAKELNISETAIYKHISELQEEDILEKLPGKDRSLYTIKSEHLDRIKEIMGRF
jgi:predicted transcriptional regulator